MIISLAVVIPGVAVLLVAAFAGRLGGYGRTSADQLVAPRNAEFGETTRLLRAEATRAQAQADLKALSTRKTDRAIASLLEDAPADRRAA